MNEKDKQYFKSFAVDMKLTDSSEHSRFKITTPDLRGK